MPTKTKSRKSTKPAVKSLKSRADLVDEILALSRSLKEAERELAAKGERLVRYIERARRQNTEIARLREDYRRETAEGLEAVTEEIDAVIACARRWHYARVHTVAEDAIGSMPSTLADATTGQRREWLDNYVNAVLHDHSSVIEDRKAWMVLAASDNCDALAEEFGAASAQTSSISERAQYAMTADVMELLDVRADEWQAPTA